MGLTKPRATQIYNLDYKQATRVATATDITLAGGAPSQVDGVNLSENDRVLVTGQNTASQNGLYDVETVGSGANGTWVRTGDGNETGEIEAGMIVMVTEGLVYADTQWKLITDNPIFIGTTPLIFVFNSLNVYFTSISAGGNVLTAAGNASVVNFAAGSGMSIVGNNVSNTITFISTGGGGSGTSISNGTSNVNVVSSGGNVTVGVGGTGNVAVFATTGIYVTGAASATGNITGNYILGNGSQLTGLPASYSNANVTTLLSEFGSNTISTTGNVTAGYFVGNGSALSSLTGANITGTVANATYAVSANNSTYSGTVTTNAQPNITSVGTLTSLSSSGNITGGNLVSATVTNPTAMTVSTNAGNINLSPTGNIVLNNTYINGLQLQPQQDQDAASKYYVDNLVTTAISYHAAVVAATNTTLATATGGTITYTQPNGVSNGIGAYLQTTGTFTTIDTANVQTVGTRILVKNEGNATYNGVYTYSNATAITRSTDTNTYAPASPSALGVNDYFFVTSGNVNAGSAWIVDAPSGVITFGTSNISFAQFSSSQIYTANTAAGLVLVNQQFNAKVDNTTTAFDGLGNITVKASAQLTTPNIGAATGSSLSVTGTVTAASTVGGVITGSSTSVTGTQTAASTVGGVITGSSVSVTGNVNATSFNGNVYSGNITTGNLLISGSSGIISGTGNIYTGNILTDGYYYANGVAFSGGGGGGGTPGGANTQIQFNDASSFGGSAGLTFNKTTNALATTGTFSATGNITGGNLIISGAITDTGQLDITTTTANSNIVLTPNGVGNVNISSNLSVTGNVTGSYVIANVVAGTGSGGNITGANIITAVTVSASGNISDGIGFLRNIPINSQTANYTLTVNDTGKFISSNTTVNIPPSIFSAGNVMTVYNNSAVSITVVAITGVTLQLAGTATVGNRTLAQRGVGTLLCVNANTFVMYGTGIT